MGGRGASGYNAASVQDEYNKKIRALSAVNQDVKKYNNIVNGKAYYSPAVKEQAEINLARAQIAKETLSAKLDLLEAQRRAYEKRKRRKKSSKNNIISLFDHKK